MAIYGHLWGFIMLSVKSILFRLSILVVSFVLSTSAYSASWLQEGFNWGLPWYATKSTNGGMLDINGVYTSDGDTDIKGALVRALWSDLEPNKGVFVYTAIDDQLAQLNADEHALIRLEVNSFCHAPSWAQSDIPSSSTKSFNFWEGAYIYNLSELVNKIAVRYRANPKVAGIHLGIGDGEYYDRDSDGNIIGSTCPEENEDHFDSNGRDGWGEFWWTTAGSPTPGGEEAIYEANNLTETNFESSVKDLIDLYANAFGSAYVGKVVWMSFDNFGTSKYHDELARIHTYAQAKKLGGRGGQIEAWMRGTDNIYGVNLVTNTASNDGSCTMTFDEAFADNIAGRYWGEENEFYGDLDYITNPAKEGSVGPLSNQTYRFFVSSMRALQLRRNYFSINAPGHAHLRNTQDEYNSAEFIQYLSKTMGRTRFDTPDAFVLLGDRAINTFSGLYPDEYKTDAAVANEDCLLAARNKGYATVSDFGRWLSVVSATTPDTSMKKSFPDSERNWGQILSYPRPNENNVTENYELYARKSSAMYVDIHNQLMQERCAGSCSIRVHAVFKDDHVMNLQVVPSSGAASTVLQTYGDGFIRTATFELNNFVGGGTLPDFHLKTTDGSDVSVIMLRVTFEGNQVVTPTIPAIPVGLSPNSNAPAGDVTFTWQPVSGATDYIVSYSTTAGYQPGAYATAVSQNCASGTCSQTISNLPAGAGMFWVKAKNSTGESLDWSTTVAFTLVNSLTVPSVIEPINFVETQGSVTVSWMPTGATEYRVSHGHAVDSSLYQEGVNKTATELGCNTGVCKQTIYNLAGGENIWWVRSSDGANHSEWSTSGHFVVKPPATPIPVSPVSNVQTPSTVTVKWWPTAGALEFKVDHSNGSQGYQADIFKPASDFDCTYQCSHTFYNLEAGSSMWWVTSKSTGGESLSTGANNFTVVP